MLEQKRLRNQGTNAATSEQAGQGGDEVDEENDQIAHRRIAAGRETLRNPGRNSNSPATGIAEVKTAHRCPWQNPFVERYGGTLRRELLDHLIVLNEGHLKRLLKDFIEEYYHLARPHQGLNGDTPVPSGKPEPTADVSRLVSIPVVGGLHHRYIRVAA